MFSKPWILTAALLASLVACSQTPHSKLSRPKVTNGLSAGSAFAAVVPLHWSFDGHRVLCTATFVNDAQVLTAAHCVYKLLDRGGDASDMYVQVPGADADDTLIVATAINYFDGYEPEADGLSPHDLAVVTFPPGSAPATLPLLAGTPQIAQDFTIVGYGANEYAADGSGHTGSGIKRYGHNSISGLSDGYVEFEGLISASSDSYERGEQVSSGSGDSGGPLLIDGAIAGVDSGGSLEEAGGEVYKLSKYVNVTGSENRDFLRRALRM